MTTTFRAESKSLRLTADQVVLAGDLEIPEHATGLVLFAHGSGSSRRSPRNREVAQILRSAGWPRCFSIC